MNKKIEIVCPKCEQKQREPVMALSSYCRSCGSYLRITDGVATTNNTPSSIPRYRQGATLDIPATEKASSTWHPKKPMDNCALRKIQCFDCDHVFEVPEQAHSSICSHCNSYINLENIIINDHCNRKIKTLGNVELTRKGSAQGISITCRNLIVFGNLACSVNASGSVEIHTRGKLKIKQLKAQKFTLVRHTQLSLTTPLEAEKVIISGQLTGDIHCNGPVILTKTAKVNGDIYMKSIEVDPGATHDGSLCSYQQLRSLPDEGAQSA